MQDKITIANAPECLNTNDQAMWVLGYQAAIEARSPCLLQIQEPTTKTEALAHYSQQAILAMDEAAPAAMEVPYGWKLVPDADNMTDEQAEAIAELARVCGGGALDIYRAALTAAPTANAVKSNLVESHQIKEAAQIAPVQLPEPVMFAIDRFDAYFRSANAVTPNARISVPTSEWQALRALLAGVSAPAAQAVPVQPKPITLTVNQLRQAIEFGTGGFTPDTTDELETQLSICWGSLKDDDGNVTECMRCWLFDYPEEGAIPLDEQPTERDLASLATPQAQADARDADDADLIEWLSGQYLAADFHWGDPKTPVLVIEIPPAASVCGDFRTDVRAAIAAAKGE